jgi:hypothetical protein
MEAPRIPRESKNDDGRVKYIGHAQNSVLRYAQSSRKAKAILDPTTDPAAKGRLEDTEALLSWLEDSVDMNPYLKEKTNLPKILEVIYATPQFYFPTNLQAKARSLFEKWEAENWGAPAAPEPQAGGGVEVAEDGSSEEEGATPVSPTHRRRESAGVARTTHIPPPNHPIWGVNGIYHGLARKVNLETGFRATVFNPNLLHLKKDPKQFGHNGLEVGQWFPSQLSALFHGAVGSSQGGISGHTALGAYAIVVSNA